MSKAFGEQNPTLGETPVSWTTWHNGVSGSVVVTGDPDWGKLKLELTGEEGRSDVVDLGAAATRKFTLTENRYGTGAESATIQIRGDTSSFAQDDVTPAWETYTAPVSKGYRYVQVRATTVALGWWLLGGVNPASAIAVYQPKGAANYAASKVNLANIGTYDAADGVAYPTWNTTDGWIFDGASSQYLTTTIPVASDSTWSSIIKFSAIPEIASYMYLYGGQVAGTGNIHGVQPEVNNVNVTYHNAHYTGTNTSPHLLSGVLCMAGTLAYRDGVDESVTLLNGVTSGTPATGIGIGANRIDTGGTITFEDYATAYIQALAFYNAILTPTQVTALTTAMGLL